MYNMKDNETEYVFNTSVLLLFILLILGMVISLTLSYIKFEKIGQGF